MPRLALIAGLGALGMLSMPLHPHPSGSTDRVTPGAVRVESESQVEITLFDDRSVLKQTRRTYDRPLATGSGFTVTPDGVVVTASANVQSQDDLAIWAANKVFAEYFKVSIAADFSRHELNDPELNVRLQACYPPKTSSSTCDVKISTSVTVFPYVDPALPQGLKATILVPGDSPVAPAVLKIDAGPKANLPTVPLGQNVSPSVESTDIMSLPERPTDKTPPKLETAHFDPPGSRNFKTTERQKVDKAILGDGVGAAVIDDGKSEVVGLLAGGGQLPVSVTPADEIRNALVTAGVTPRRGPVDVVFENALASYHNKLYASAVPVLQQTLNLRPDHAVALNYLRTAKAKAGTAEDAATKKKSVAPVAKASTGLSPWIWVTGGVVLIAALIAVVVPLVMRRRRAAGTDSGEPELDPAMINSWPSQPSQSHPYGPGGPHSPPQGQPLMAPPGAGLQPQSAHVAQGSIKFCTQCGMRLGHGHRFCGYCGHPSDAQ